MFKKRNKNSRIEESTVRRMTSNIGEAAKSWEEISRVEKFLSMRDTVMARRIIEAIKSHKNNQFYVLVGQGHIDGIIQNISRQGIPNTQIRILFNEARNKAIYFENAKRVLLGKHDGFRNEAPETLKNRFEAWKKAKQDRIQRRLQQSLKRK